MKKPQSGVVLKTFFRVVKILPKQFKLSGFISFMMLFLNSALDLLGLSAVIPLILLILEENAVQQNDYLLTIYEALNMQSEQKFILTIAIFILLVIVSKNLLSLCIQYYQANFSYNLQRYYSIRLYRSYYAKGFLYFKSLNSANIVRNIQAVPTAFAVNILLPLMTVINELVMISLILTGLLIYQAEILLLLVAVVGPAFLIFYAATKNLNKLIAEKQHELMPQLSKNIVESVYGYLDVQVTNTQNHFFERHERLQREMTRLLKYSQVLKVAPNKILETSLFLGVITIIVYGVYYFDNRKDLITLLGVFALSAYRIMPSVNRILMGVISLNGFRYTLDLIESELTSISNHQGPKKNEEINFKNGIEVDNVSFKYSKDLPEVLTGVNVTVKKGKSVGFIGKSGSGKSTMMNLLLGFIQPTSGQIRIDDQPLTPNRLMSWRKKLGYVQQEVYLVDGTIRENVAFGLNTRDIDDHKVWESLRLASLANFVENLDDQLDHQVGERGGNLSGGQRQRIGIARSLYFGAEVLFFDEATSALDNETETEVTEAINKLQQSDLTMIIIAHRITTLKYCDHIYQLDEGHLVGEVSYETLVKEVV